MNPASFIQDTQPRFLPTTNYGKEASGAFLDAFGTFYNMQRQKKMDQVAIKATETKMAQEEQLFPLTLAKLQRDGAVGEKQAQYDTMKLDQSIDWIQKGGMEKLNMGMDGGSDDYGRHIKVPLPQAEVPQFLDEIDAPVTSFSTGKDVGGPDEMQDKWTNKGYSATGPNLTEGVVAVNTSKYPLGTIFKDQETGEVYLAADKHGNSDPTVIDAYMPPDKYKPKKENRKFAVLGRIPKEQIPKTPEGIQQFLSQYRNT